MKERLTRKGTEFYGKAFPAEVARIRRLAKERGLCAAIALGIWAALLARAGTRVLLEGDAAPSISGLSGELGIDRSTLQRYLAVLEAGDLLTIDRPPGRKPVWMVAPRRPYVENLPPCAAGRASEGETAGDAAEDGTPCSGARHPLPGRAAPAPPRDRETEREERVGGGELRKTGFRLPAPDVLGGVMQQAAAKLAQLRSTDPEAADALEEETLDALEGKADDDASAVGPWRRVIELNSGRRAPEPEGAETAP